MTLTSYLFPTPGFFPTTASIAARESTYPLPPCENGNPATYATLPRYSSSLGSIFPSHSTSVFHSTYVSASTKMYQSFPGIILYAFSAMCTFLYLSRFHPDLARSWPAVQGPTSTSQPAWSR